MTRFPHDQFAKQYLKELLSPLGEVETSRDIPGEVREDELLAIIKPLMELPPEEFTPTLMQSSRSELLARFGKIRGLTEV